MRALPLLRQPVMAAAPTRMRMSGNHRSRVTTRGYHAGRKPGNWGNIYPAEILTLGEMRALLDATGNGYAGARDRALYVTLWRTGLRISEALDLLPKDVDLERGRLVVLCGKNSKRRVVGLDEQTIAELERWMVKRTELGVGRQEPVFCVISHPTVGKRLYSSCVREQLRDCAARAGIEKRVHPHGLRHTFASELADEGVPINVISRLLGHSNSGTTARYIDHINPAAAIDVARARVWER
jgi:site-specific recombinase XerD